MKASGGILVYKRERDDCKVLLVHLGGPLWAHKDTWSIPKGELDAGEDHLTAARREFEEEVGLPVPDGTLIDLGTADRSRKTDFVWAVEGDLDLTKFSCNNFTMEWPPKSGQLQEFPENDAADWFSLEVARTKVFPSEWVFLERLGKYLQVTIPAEPEQQSLL